MRQKTVITAEPDSLKVYLEKIWKHRSLITTLAKRDVKIKYAQTTIGLGWVLLQPLVAVAVYTIFFSVLLDFDTPYPYAIFVLSGVLLWGLFNYIFSQGSNALLQNQDLIRKLFFPKIILPMSKVLVALTEFVVILLLLITLILVYGVPVSFKLIFALPITLLVVLFSLGLAFILSAATLKNRDLNHIVPFLVNFGIWFTPVFYPVTIIPEQFKDLLYLNPMAAFIQLFRWSLFGEEVSTYVWLGVLLGLLIFIVGFFVFKRKEDSVVDLM